ncbi:apolipoprotein N-acyltransferase [Roseimarinus sediminis]|uniref:apolipoprotein N-acyltransferase n=1 Tax=Roseimarinus sediminis TaxID=1610899 RepID=UPI003D19BB57
MKLKFVALSVLSGVLLSMAWLGMSGLVLLFAWLPLLFLNHYFTLHKNQYTPLAFWMYAFLSVLLWNGLSTWWIWHATPAGALFAIFTNSLLMSLVWWAVHFAYRIKGNGFGNLFLIFAFLSFEYLHYNWPLSWPWLNLGNGLANDIRLIQWYEYTGVQGGTLWILLSNLVLWNLLKKYWIEGLAIRRQLMIVSVLLLFVPVIISLIRFANYSEKDDPVQVVVAQPNIDPYSEKFSGMSHREQYRRMLQLADSLGDETTDFYVAPETALHQLWQHELESQAPVRMISRFLDEKQGEAAFVSGAMTYLRYHEDEATPTARYSDDSTLIYDAFNSALLIPKDGEIQLSHKAKLVAGVETMPFERQLRFLNKLVVDLGGTTGTLATNNDTVVLVSNDVPVGVPVCYESAFGEYVSGFVHKGAELLFVITNDGWWKNSPGYRQHFSYARIQAISLRRSIARSANTGISALINQKGEIIQQSEWWTGTALKGTLNRNRELTFYARSGDYLARMSVLMLVLMSLSLLVAKIKK